ncbi:MAG: hypothetical protein ACK4YF_04945 [Exilispira sp.]
MNDSIFFELEEEKLKIVKIVEEKKIIILKDAATLLNVLEESIFKDKIFKNKKENEKHKNDKDEELM